MADNDNKTQQNQGEEDLSKFNFDDNVEFFGVKTESSQESGDSKTIKEVKNAKASDDEEDDGIKTTDLDAEKKEEKKEVSKKKTAEPKFFQDDKGEEDDDLETAEEEAADKKERKDKDGKKEDNKEEGKDEDKDDAKFYTSLAEELKEKGVFQNVEIKEGEEITEEKFFELQDAEVEARVQETFETFFKELDEDGKAFLKFKKDGGKTADFIATLSYDPGIEELDSNNKEQVDKVLVHYLTHVEKLDAEELKDRMEFLEEGGKKKAYAEKYFKALEEEKVEQQKKIQKATETANKKRDKDAEDFKTSLTATLEKTEAVQDIVITKADQKDLVAMITKPTVKVGNGKYVPDLSFRIAKIFKAATPEDQQRLLALAKVVRDDFALPDSVTKQKTEVVKKTKDKLQSAKLNPKAVSSGGGAKKQLSDFFVEE